MCRQWRWLRKATRRRPRIRERGLLSLPRDCVRPIPTFVATPFKDVANNPGMTGTALAVWLQTSHPTMPNFILEKQDMLNVVAYILSLKDDDQPH